MNGSLTTQRLFRGFSHSRIVRTAALIGVAALVTLTGILVFAEFRLLLVAPLAVGIGVAMFRWPDLATLIVLGLVYSNLPVVAVQFHGAPAILPAAVLALLAWPLFHRVYVCKEPLWLCSATPFLAAFGGVVLVGALTAREPRLAYDNFISFVLEGVVLYLLVTNVIRTRRLAVGVFWILAACALLMGSVPLLQQATGTFDSNYGGLAQIDAQFSTAEDARQGVIHQQRAAGTIGEQNRYAQFMLLLVPIGFSLIGMAGSARLRLLAIGATLAALLGFALGFSRGAAVGLVAAFAVAVWLKLLGRKQVKLAFVAMGLVLLLFPQYLTRLSTLSTVGATLMRGTSGLDAADGAVRGRVTEMGAALLVFRDHPLVGVGPGMFAEYSQEYGQTIGLRPLAARRQAHSLPLDIAAEHGLLGLITFAAVIIVVFRVLLRARRVALERDDNVGLHLTTGVLLALLLYLTTGLFLHLSYIRYFWLLIALADAIGAIVIQGDRGRDFLPRPKSMPVVGPVAA